MYSISTRSLAELFGTFWLVFGGCGSAVLAAKFITPEQNTPINIGIGLVGVSLAFGLTVLTMAYTIGHISGCHLNPAVSVGLAVGGRFKAAELLPYVLAQVAGAVAGAGVLYLIASGKPGFAVDTNAGRGVRHQRLRRLVPWRLFVGCLRDGRGGADRVLHLNHPRCHRQAGTGWLRPIGHWTRTDTYPPDWHSGHEPVGQPGPEHRTGPVRLAAPPWCSSGCSGLPR